MFASVPAWQGSEEAFREDQSEDGEVGHEAFVHENVGRAP